MVAVSVGASVISEDFITSESSLLSAAHRFRAARFMEVKPQQAGGEFCSN